MDENTMVEFEVLRPDDNFSFLEWFDTVFYTGDFSEDEVRRSLIDHDGYPGDIKVVRKER